MHAFSAAAASSVQAFPFRIGPLLHLLHHHRRRHHLPAPPWRRQISSSHITSIYKETFMILLCAYQLTAA